MVVLLALILLVVVVLSPKASRGQAGCGPTPLCPVCTLPRCTPEGIWACDSYVAAGTACNPGNACISGATCDGAGTCAGTAVQCTPINSCHAAGTCNPSNGTCSVGPVTCPVPGAPGPISGPSLSSLGSYTISWGAASGIVYYYLLYENGVSSNVGLNLGAFLSGKAEGLYTYRVTAC